MNPRPFYLRRNQAALDKAQKELSPTSKPLRTATAASGASRETERGRPYQEKP